MLPTDRNQSRKLSLHHFPKEYISVCPYQENIAETDRKLLKKMKDVCVCVSFIIGSLDGEFDSFLY